MWQLMMPPQQQQRKKVRDLNSLTHTHGILCVPNNSPILTYSHTDTHSHFHFITHLTIYLPSYYTRMVTQRKKTISENKLCFTTRKCRSRTKKIYSPIFPRTTSQLSRFKLLLLNKKTLCISAKSAVRG